MSTRMENFKYVVRRWVQSLNLRDAMRTEETNRREAIDLIEAARKLRMSRMDRSQTWKNAQAWAKEQLVIDRAKDTSFDTLFEIASARYPDIGPPPWENDTQ